MAYVLLLLLAMVLISNIQFPSNAVNWPIIMRVLEIQANIISVEMHTAYVESQPFSIHKQIKTIWRQTENNYYLTYPMSSETYLFTLESYMHNS